jgi:hypothetical protein
MTEILHSQMLNATFWLAPNARLLQTKCAWCEMHTTPHRGRSCDPTWLSACITSGRQGDSGDGSAGTQTSLMLLASFAGEHHCMLPAVWHGHIGRE